MCVCVHLRARACLISFKVDKFLTFDESIRKFRPAGIEERCGLDSFDEVEAKRKRNVIHRNGQRASRFSEKLSSRR